MNRPRLSPLMGNALAVTSRTERADELPLLAPSHAPSLLESSPFVVDLAAFASRFGQDGRRDDLIRRLLARFDEFETSGARVDCALIGGSFARPARLPRDLDALLIYSVLDPERFQPAMEGCLRRGTNGLDLRFLARDAETALLAKMIAFFAVLYAGVRDDPSERGPTLLLIP